MIPVREFKTLALALPKCYISKPSGCCSWIMDKNKTKIGSIHWGDARITVFQEYEYSEEVIEAIGKTKFKNSIRHFDPDKDLPIEKEPPPLPDVE